MKRMSIDFNLLSRSWIFVTVCLAGNAVCQTQLNLGTQSKNVDFTSAISTKPFKSGTALPPLCSTAETFFNVNAQPGQNLYVCTSLNTWTLAGTSASASASGITSLNGLLTSSQTFTNDTNVTIISGGSAHVIRWSGALAKLRQHAATVYTDQSNMYAGAFVQDFSAISHVRLPVVAGYTPTITGHLGYDSTANVYKGYNGSAVKTLAFLDSSITGNAATATAFASSPAKCSAGNYPLGIDALGNAQSCTAPSGTGDSAGQKTIPFSATPTYAITKNSLDAQTMTLTANVTSSTLTVASGTPLINLSLCQDSNGGHTNVWPTNVIGAPVISADAGACTTIGGSWNGSNLSVSSSNINNSAAPPALIYQIAGSTYTQLLPASNGTIGSGGAAPVIGTYTGKGAAGTVGKVYYTTDSYYGPLVDDGANWNHFINGKLATVPVLATFTAIGFTTPACVSSSANGGFVITHPASPTPMVCILEKAAPATPWTKTVFYLSTALATSFHRTGVVMRDGTGKFVFAGFGGAGQGGSLVFFVDYWTDPVTYGSTVLSAGSPVPGNSGVWMQFGDDGTNLSVKYSADGITFVQLWSGARTALLTAGPTQYGVGIDSNGTLPDAITVLSLN